jgi:hypothetical protein
MDAYIIQQKIFDAWKVLAPNFSASDVKKQYNVVPVYVDINGELVEVTNVTIINDKVVIKC